MAAPKPVILVLGTGNAGTATVRELSARAADRVEIRVATRDPTSAKATELAALPGVSVVTGDVHDTAALPALFAGADSVFINTPGSEDRGEAAATAANLAASAGVKHVVVVSNFPPGGQLRMTEMFGRQFATLEGGVQAAGADFTLLRLPFFDENQWGNLGSIKGQSTIYAPVSPDKPWRRISIADVGKFAAEVLLNPEAHLNKSYKLLGEFITYNQIVEAFAEALGRPINFVQVPGTAAVEAMKGMGFPGWQAEGIIDIWDAIQNDIRDSATGDFEAVMGRPTTSFREWVEGVKGAFA